MKITVIGPVYPYRGGIAHYTSLLTQALQRAQNEVQVISFRRQYPAFLYPGKTDKDPSQSSIKVAASYPLDPLLPWTWLQTSQEILKTHPDGIVFQWWTTFWAIPFAILAWRFRKLHISILFVIHNVVPHEPRSWDVWLVRRALSRGDRYIALNPKEELLLRKLTGAQNVHVHPLPVYNFFQQQALIKNEARRRLNLPEDRFILLFFGLVRPYKGLPVLLEALAISGSKDAHPFLVIAGEFWDDLDNIRSRIAELGLQAHVRLDNRYIPDEEVGLYFSAADCLAAPYIGGTQSGAVSIATGFGLPLIVTPHIAKGLPPGAYQALVIVVPPGDVNALAAAIAWIAGSPQEHAAPRLAGSDWDQMAKIVMDILAE